MENSVQKLDDCPDMGQSRSLKPTRAQLDYLRCGLDQPGGKLPLFDHSGKEINSKTIRACIDRKWAEPWFSNPMKPTWLVCKLTDEGRKVSQGKP